MNKLLPTLCFAIYNYGTYVNQLKLPPFYTTLHVKSPNTTNIDKILNWTKLPKIGIDGAGRKYFFAGEAPGPFPEGAQALCANHGTTLATVIDSDDIENLKQAWIDEGYTINHGTDCILGLSDQNAEGDWKWYDGTVKFSIFAYTPIYNHHRFNLFLWILAM